MIAELKDEGETETGYAQVGALSIHMDEDKIKKMQERAQLRKADAPEIGEITPLDAEETHERFPLLGEQYQSVHISGAARIDGRALRRCSSSVCPAKWSKGDPWRRHASVRSRSGHWSGCS